MKNLYLIIGRSGSGKTVATEELAKRFGYKTTQSYTTRPPRYEGEVGHTFVSKEDFDKLDLLAYTKFNNYEYGVDSKLLNKADLYVIDIDGTRELLKNYHDKKCITINIRCDKVALAQHMDARGDSIKQMAERLNNDDIMFADESTFKFDYIVKNDEDIETLVSKIDTIIKKEEF